MSYLIDGNNLIGRSSDFNLKSPFSRELLIKELLAFQKKKDAKITIVFDGIPDEHLNRQFLSLGKMEIIFAGRKISADARILQIIQRSSDPASIILVSSDKKLTDRATR
jgi:predicted RNA-binding protein with PIN domain